MNHSPREPVPATPLEQRASQFQALSLHDVLFWIRKWKWEFLAVAVTTVLATLVYIMLFRDPAFVSEARLFVRLSQEQTAPRTLVTNEGTTLLTPATSDVTSEIDLYSLLVDPASGGPSRDEILSALADLGVEARPFFPPIHRMTFHVPPGAVPPDDLPVTDRLARDGFSLPTHNALTPDQAREIAWRLKQVLVRETSFPVTHHKVGAA